MWSLEKRVSSGLASIALLAATACGHATAPSTSALKIRNGSEVSSSDRGPQHVSTVGLVGLSDEGQYICSAAVLSDTLLVTAAHCVQSQTQIAAVFDVDLRQASRSSVIPVTTAVVDPDHDVDGERVTPHDIAVLQLKSPIPSEYRPIKLLPASARLREGQSVLIAGYGVTGESEDSGILRAVETTYAGANDEGQLGIQDDQDRGACSGDSGGPLFVQGGGSWYLGGVLSGGPSPCQGLNVYTSITAHLDFLRAAVGRLSR